MIDRLLDGYLRLIYRLTDRMTRYNAWVARQRYR